MKRGIHLLLVVLGAACAQGPAPLPPPSDAPPPPAPHPMDESIPPVEAARRDTDAASSALQSGDAAAAQLRLERAAHHLEAIHAGWPGVELLERIDEAIGALEGPGTADLAGLLVALEGQANEIGHDVLTPATAARALTAEGRTPEAVEALRATAQAVSRELGLGPLEQARARVARARELATSDAAQASHALSKVPALLEESRAQAALVNARQRLRAAASALELGRRDHAQWLLGEAVGELDRAEELPFGGVYEYRVRSVNAQARRLLRRLDGESPPDPRDLRRIASQTFITG